MRESGSLLLVYLSLWFALSPPGCPGADPTQAEFAGIQFVRIPAGTFLMGSDKTAEELSEIYGDRVFYFQSEQPQHEVTISQGFWLGKFEVTQAQWRAVMGGNPSYDVGDNLPVEQVSWNECLEFIERLNALGEGVFRLPTEAEWEYACRAGTTTEFSFGDDLDLLDAYCWYFTNSGYRTHPVGGKSPNPWGLYDMHGNVFEWCKDWYGSEYYAAAPPLDPQGPDDGKYRVRRGGTFARTDSFCRSAFRFWNGPNDHLSNTGLRLVCEIE